MSDHPSEGRFVGRRLPRREDRRLLTGEALFVDDVEPADTLHAAFVRSPEAHARLRRVDVGPALRRRGVVAAFTAADLGDLDRPGPLLVPPPPVPDLTFRVRTQRPLARERVRHVGEAVAVVVAESRYLAEDAVEAVVLETDPLAVVSDLERALDPEAPRVHEDLDSNLAAHGVQRKGDWEAARREAVHRVGRRFRYDRGVAAAIENRGVVARWDHRSRRLTVWDTTQAPIPVRAAVARALGLAESEVRVVAPFIGGGFGPKIMLYPEELLVPWLAMRLGRPVKWIEDRHENFFATTQERAQVHEAEIALDGEGRILGVRDEFLHDTGAYDPYGLTLPINTQCHLLGPYRVPAYHGEFRVVFTNRPIVTPVRGAGRQHGVFVMERLLDLAAREIGMDRVEIRRRNLIPSDAFPWDNEILNQDSAPFVYDSGDYGPALERAAAIIGYRPSGGGNGPGDGDAGGASPDAGAGRPSSDAEAGRSSSDAGPRVGVGIVCYVEGTGVGPYEGARVTVEPGGTVSVTTGVGTQGQGHFTTFAQVVAEELGVDPSRVRVVTGDTSEFHWGTGTFASRGAVVAGSACHAAARAVRDKALALAADLLEVSEEDLVLEDGRVTVRGSPSHGVDLGELAVRSNPLRGAVQPGTEPGLEAYAYFGPEGGSTASGVHAVELEVDPETAMVRILRYVVVHDCGRILNPMIVEGQIHGGVAMGIGNAFYEELCWDEEGQLRNASFMDYLLPTADVVPRIETAHFETPSPLNPLGVKGVGEAGAIPVAAAFAQALEDAIGEPGLEILEMPLSPVRLFELLEGAAGRTVPAS